MTESAIDMSASILLIEDQPDVAAAVVKLCQDELSLTPVLATDGEEGARLARTGDFSMVILDIGLPHKSGLDICRELRQERPKLPIMILSGRETELDKVLGLELGADDYVTKPFAPRELVARIRACLRRAGTDPDGTITTYDAPVKVGDLTLDAGCRRVWKGSQELELTYLEFELLHALMSHPGRVFSRDSLIGDILGYSSGDYSGAVSAHISRIRSKIEDDVANPKYLLTVRNVGYRFATVDELNA